MTSTRADRAAHAELASALARLAARSPELLELTRSWSAINSHSGHRAGVDAVGDAIAAALAPLPLTLTRVPGGPWGSHLCFATPACAERPALLLVGHHDTVFPPGSFESVREAGGLLRGPGVLDMKGGLAVVSVVLRCLHDLGKLVATPLCFVSVADEEVGSPSSRALFAKLAAQSYAALVFEAGRSGDRIVTMRRGSGFARVTAHGRAAHAGNNLAEGRNAIWALARFLDRVQSAGAALPGASLSTGLIEGGSARNTVAERAHAELDLRFEDHAGERAVAQLLERLARDVEAELPGTRLELELQVTRAPLECSDASRALCERYGASQLAAGLAAGEAPRQGGGSDANTLAALGVPVIDGLGPRGRGFHSHDEQIEVASLALKAEALLRFVLAEPALAARDSK